MVRKVLIIQTAFLGDLLLCIPLIKRVRSLFPHCEIDLICRAGFGNFFVSQGLVRKAFEIRKGESESYQEILGKIDAYDICICPHQSYRTAMFVRKVKAEKKVGFRRWWNFFIFNERVSRDLRLPDALRQMSLLQKWDSQLIPRFRSYFNSHQVLDPIEGDFSMGLDVARVRCRYELAESLTSVPFVILAPGSQWPTKRWPEEGFAQLAREVKKQGLEVALVGAGAEDARINRRLAESIPGLIDLTDLTNLNELAWLMTKAKKFYGNDSGLMHLAAVARLPTVAIFGPTTLELGYRPWQNEARVVEKNLFCRPCGKHGHKKCPLGTHECMKSIKVTDVLS